MELSTELIINGVAGILAVCVGINAFLTGRRSSKKEEAKPSTVQIAGALVSDAMAKELITSFHDLMSSNRELGKHLERCAEATEQSAREVREVRVEIGVLTREFVRGQNKGD